MSIPSESHQIPPDLLRIAGKNSVLLWRNLVGGYTARSAARPGWIIKWHPLTAGEYLHEELVRLQWLSGLHSVPGVVDFFLTQEAEVLVTQELPGLSAIDPAYLARPEVAMRAIGTGLRQLHGLPVAECPFEWSVESRISLAQNNGVVVPHNFPPAPPVDQLVVCHGDACAPNTLLSHDGDFLAHVDMGSLGVGDRWADLSVALISLDRNYPGSDHHAFWEAYGIVPDMERIHYYQALWDLGSRA